MQIIHFDIERGKQVYNIGAPPPPRNFENLQGLPCSVCLYECLMERVNKIVPCVM